MAVNQGARTPSVHKTIASLSAATVAATITTAAVIFLWFGMFTVHAEPTDPQPNFGMARPGEPCRVGLKDIPATWNDADKWAWKKICEGQDANFNARLGIEFNPGNPEHQEHWSDERRFLSRDFLKTILLHEPFRSAIPHQGIRINGAVFKHVIDLQDGEISRPIVLRSSAFELPVTLDRVTTSSFVSFDGSNFTGKLRMDSVSIGAHLFMREAVFRKVDLRNADIGGQVNMVRSRFLGMLNMDSISIGQSLLMREGADFQEVDLTNADIGSNVSMDGSMFRGFLKMNFISIGGDLFMYDVIFGEVSLIAATIAGHVAMNSSTFQGNLIMNSISVGGNLFMRDQAEFRAVDLRTANISGRISIIRSRFLGTLNMNSIRIGKSLIMRDQAEFRAVDLTAANISGQVDMDGSAFLGKLNLDSISIDRHLLMRGPATFREVIALAANIVGNLDTRGSELESLDLTGARIDRELVLGSQEGTVTWTARKDRANSARSVQLKLQNTTIGVLQDTKTSWPPALELEGFTYNRLGVKGANVEDMPHQRGSDWFIAWLARDNSYSPQPYRQLAGVLDASGHKNMANDILFASRERERTESNPSEGNWWLLSALKFTIGYGYGLRYFWVVGWLVIFTLIGTCWLRCEKECHDNGKKLGFWFSLDMLLPIIQLRKRHYEIDLPDKGVRYYFFSHKLVGYVLVFFVIAGLTGLTE